MWKRDRERKLDNVKEMEREYEKGGERMCQGRNREKQGTHEREIRERDTIQKKSKEKEMDRETEG